MAKSVQQDLFTRLLNAGTPVRLSKADACRLLGNCENGCRHRRVRSLRDRGLLKVYNDHGVSYFLLTDVVQYLEALAEGPAEYRGPEESRGGKNSLGKKVAA